MKKKQKQAKNRSASGFAVLAEGLRLNREDEKKKLSLEEKVAKLSARVATLEAERRRKRVAARTEEREFESHCETLSNYGFGTWMPDMDDDPYPRLITPEDHDIIDFSTYERACETYADLTRSMYKRLLAAIPHMENHA